jgi:hypothetical protein
VDGRRFPRIHARCPPPRLFTSGCVRPNLITRARHPRSTRTSEIGPGTWGLGPGQSDRLRRSSSYSFSYSTISPIVFRRHRRLHPVRTTAAFFQIDPIISQSVRILDRSGSKCPAMIKGRSRLQRCRRGEGDGPAPVPRRHRSGGGILTTDEHGWTRIKPGNSTQTYADQL